MISPALFQRNDCTSISAIITLITARKTRTGVMPSTGIISDAATRAPNEEPARSAPYTAPGLGRGTFPAIAVNSIRNRELESACNAGKRRQDIERRFQPRNGGSCRRVNPQHGAPRECCRCYPPLDEGQIEPGVTAAFEEPGAPRGTDSETGHVHPDEKGYSPVQISEYRLVVP